MDTDDTPWRPKQHQRLATWLAKGERLVVVGGPGLGKQYLFEALGDAAPSQVTLRGVENLTEPVGGARLIPLGNLPKHHVESRWGVEAFEQTAGHPGLLAGWLRGQRTEATERYAEQYKQLGAAHPEHWGHWEQLRDYPGTPTERYAWALEQGLTKSHLDWLACAGLIARSIHGDRAGAVCLPL